MSAAATLRPATAADVGAIEALVRDAFTPYVARIGKPPGPMQRAYAPHVAAGEVEVLEADGALAGVLVARPATDSYYVDVVAVAPARRGQGLGRRLMARAEARARAAGFHALTLLTNELMVENLVLYARLGFVETRRAEEDGFRRVYMRKALGEDAHAA